MNFPITAKTTHSSGRGDFIVLFTTLKTGKVIKIFDRYCNYKLGDISNFWVDVTDNSCWQILSNKGEKETDWNQARWE